MLKHKSFLQNSYRFYRRFVLSPRKRSLLGGVLLVCALAFLPVPVSAYQNSYDSWNSNTSFSDRFNIYGACIYGFYGPDSNIYMATSLDNSHTCNYRHVNYSIGYYSDSPVGYSSTSSNTDTSGNNSQIVNNEGYSGGYNPAVWPSDFAKDYGLQYRNSVNSIHIEFDQNKTIPHIQRVNSSSTSALFYYRFKFNAAGNPGSVFPAMFNIANLSLKNVSLNGSPVVDNDLNNLRNRIMNNINDSLFFTCGLSDYTSLFPDSESFDSSDCYLLGEIGLSDHIYEITSFDIVPNTNPSDYNTWELNSFNFSELPSYAFNSIFMNPYTYSDYANGLTNNAPDKIYSHTNIRFKVITCDSVNECKKFDEYRGNFKLKRVYNTDSNFDDISDNTWNIFSGLNFLLPFDGLFNFTDDSCVDLPLIASWLKWPNSQYCSWWPENIKTTLDPIFDIFIVLFGFWFVFKWLNSKESLNVEGGA